MTNFINADGFSSTQSDKLPDSDQVEFCKKILSLVKQRATFNYKNSSYGYKHTLEKNYDDHYISNGALLLAGQQLNFDIERDGPNGYFKFTTDDLDLAIIQYYSSQNTLNQDNVKLLTDVFKQSKIKTYSTSLYNLYSYIIQRKKVTPFEIFTTLNNLGISIKNKSCVHLEDVNTKNVAWTRDIYIPISMTKVYKLI